MKLVVFTFISLLVSFGTAIMVGGWQTRDVNEPEIKEAAKKILDQANQKQNSTVEIIEIISAKSQVVSGIQYKIELLIGPPKCVAKTGDSDVCSSDEKKTLTGTLWSQPWLEEGEREKIEII